MGKLHYSFEIPPISLADYRRAQAVIVADWWRQESRVTVARVLGPILFGATTAALALTAYTVDPLFSVAIVMIWTGGEIILLGWKVFGIGMLLFLLGGACVTWIVRRQQRRGVEWFYETSRTCRIGYKLQVLEEEIVSYSPMGQRRTSWGTVTRFVQSGDLWLLIVDAVTFYWIPDVLVREREGFQTFVEGQIARHSSGTSAAPA
jgi:hypothetical protein